MSTLHLPTLKHIQYVFTAQSDFSTRCHGYDRLCKIIDEAEQEMGIVEGQPNSANIKVQEILNKHLPPKGKGTKNEKIRTALLKDICALIAKHL